MTRLSIVISAVIVGVRRSSTAPRTRALIRAGLRPLSLHIAPKEKAFGYEITEAEYETEIRQKYTSKCEGPLIEGCDERIVVDAILFPRHRPAASADLLDRKGESVFKCMADDTLRLCSDGEAENCELLHSFVDRTPLATAMFFKVVVFGTPKPAWDVPFLVLNLHLSSLNATLVESATNTRSLEDIEAVLLL